MALKYNYYQLKWLVVVAQLRAVASNTRGPWFDSNHWQVLFTINCIGKCFEKTKIKKKRPGNVHLKNLDKLTLNRERSQVYKIGK